MFDTDRLVWDEGVAGSNPAAPTINSSAKSIDAEKAVESLGAHRDSYWDRYAHGSPPDPTTLSPGCGLGSVAGLFATTSATGVPLGWPNGTSGTARAIFGGRGGGQSSLLGRRSGCVQGPFFPLWLVLPCFDKAQVSVLPAWPYRRSEPPISYQCSVCDEPLPQHFLNFLPEPQGHGSFLPTFVDRMGSRCGSRRSGLRQ